jgi:transaldolase
MINVIQATYQLGQSLWYDNIQRRLLENGEMATLINRGDIRGMTSNPSIFNNAIGKTTDYDEALNPLARSGLDSEKIFWQLAIEDIQHALDLFTPMYKNTKGRDGFVSLEVNPAYANDTDTTLDQVRYLWEIVNRPNLMVKIPATQEGLPAIRKAISEGININVTLIFSLERYREVMQAYLDGIRSRLKAGKPVDHVSSVASFFVSRLDTKIDPSLPDDSDMKGKAAIANTKLAYLEFSQVFGRSDFKDLQNAGCQLQRPLWASTSTKNPNYPDTLYVDELIGPQTVNTVPPETLDAFRDHGKAVQTITKDVEGAHRLFANLEKVGISMKVVTKELEEAGVISFKDAFMALLKTIEIRRKQAVEQPPS